MSLLDDLKAQAENQRASEQEGANLDAQRDQYYRDEIQPQMVKAYQFFNEMVGHLNYIKPETIVTYPLLPEGKLQRLRQQEYKVVIDSSKSPKQIDITMECVLDKPVNFEMFGRDAILSLAERIERYSIKHERKIRKNASMEPESAKFILEGPMPISVQLKADVDAGDFKLAVRNFYEPGFTRYTIKPAQFNDQFLDRLGKYVLREETNLLGGEEISEEVKAALRKKIEEENNQREQELREAEERLKAEEAAAKEKSKKEQVKRAVETQVNQKKEKLKDMFNRLKLQAGFDESPSDKS